MKRIFVVMVSSGLAMGFVFPFFVSPFVIWGPDRRLFFKLASLAAGFVVGYLLLLFKATLYQRNLLLASKKAELEKAKGLSQ
jgi:hypothetical protein